MNPAVDNKEKLSTKSLREALCRTLSDEHIELLLIYLKNKNAIYQGNEIDIRKLEGAMRELFGEGVVIFFELILQLENKSPNMNDIHSQDDN
jgi:hypothetical protein